LSAALKGGAAAARLPLSVYRRIADYHGHATAPAGCHAFPPLRKHETLRRGLDCAIYAEDMHPEVEITYGVPEPVMNSVVAGAGFDTDSSGSWEWVDIELVEAESVAG